MTSIDRSIVSEYVNKLAVNNNISDKVKDKVINSIANDGVISKEEVDDIQGLLNQERLEQNGGKCEINPENPDAENIQGSFVEFMGKITKQSTFTPQGVQFSIENGALAVKTKEEVKPEKPKPEVTSVESVKPAKIDPKPTEVKPKTPYGVFTQKDFKYNTPEAKENNSAIKTLKTNPNIVINKNSKTGVAFITTKGKEADSDVRKLQEMLKVKVDGKIGPQTLDAIVKNYTMLKVTNHDTSELDTIVAKLGLGDLLKDKSISGKNFSEAIAPKKLEEITMEPSELLTLISFRPLIPLPVFGENKPDETTPVKTDDKNLQNMNSTESKSSSIPKEVTLSQTNIFSRAEKQDIAKKILDNSKTFDNEEIGKSFRSMVSQYNPKPSEIELKEINSFISENLNNILNDLKNVLTSVKTKQDLHSVIKNTSELDLLNLAKLDKKADIRQVFIQMLTKYKDNTTNNVDERIKVKNVLDKLVNI